MTIKYLVISGGGGSGFYIYGAVKTLSQNKFWNIEDIQSIYATSIGSFISTFLSLKYDWNYLDDYIIKRPWDKVFSFNPGNLFNVFNNIGIFDIDIIKLIFCPLLTAKDLSESITLKEFYEYNNIDFHLYSVNINTEIPTLIDISHKTHPELELIKAIYMSSAYPVLFKPLCDGSCCYVDGGIMNNFPLRECINQVNFNGDKQENILACTTTSLTKIDLITSESNLYNYLYFLIIKMHKLTSNQGNQIDISNLLCCKLEYNSHSDWKDAMYNQIIRENMINSGIQSGEEFLRERNIIPSISNPNYS